MSAATLPIREPTLDAILSAADPVELRPFTREEFYEMDRAGIFENDTRVELIDGRIIRDMSPISGPHAFSVDELNMFLTEAVRGKPYRVRVQSGIALPGDRELQPDLAVYAIPKKRTTYNPTADQVILVIEVAASSIYRDRTDKARLYAEANIPVYWVVDVPRKRVFVHQAPEDGMYSKIEQVAGDELLEVQGKTFRAAEIF
jgi:Uma2 family endonuclease